MPRLWGRELVPAPSPRSAALGLVQGPYHKDDNEVEDIPTIFPVTPEADQPFQCNIDDKNKKESGYLKLTLDFNLITSAGSHGHVLQNYHAECPLAAALSLLPWCVTGCSKPSYTQSAQPRWILEQQRGQAASVQWGGEAVHAHRC